MQRSKLIMATQTTNHSTVPKRYKWALIVLGCLALAIVTTLAVWVIRATYGPHDMHPPETIFRVEPSELIYPNRGYVVIYWDGINTVIDQVTWLEMTGANRGLQDS